MNSRSLIVGVAMATVLSATAVSHAQDQPELQEDESNLTIPATVSQPLFGSKTIKVKIDGSVLTLENARFEEIAGKMMLVGKYAKKHNIPKTHIYLDWENVQVVCGQPPAEGNAAPNDLAEAATQPDDKTVDHETDVEKAVRDSLWRQAKGYKFESLASGGEPVEISLYDRSILNWTNPIRGADVGIITLWEDDGLPLAFATIFSTGSSFRHSLTSISDHPLNATYQERQAWTPAANMPWRKWDNDPSPVAETEALRKVQMQSIAKQLKFSFMPYNPGDGKESELRLLPEPIHRFQSDKHGVIDGAIFAFAEDDDAEAVVIFRANEAQETWEYAFARCGFFAMKGRLGDQAVWEVDSVTRGSREEAINSPYISSIVPITESRSVAFENRKLEATP